MLSAFARVERKAENICPMCKEQTMVIVERCCPEHSLEIMEFCPRDHWVKEIHTHANGHRETTNKT